MAPPEASSRRFSLPAPSAQPVVEEGEGIGVAIIEDPTEDLARWRSYATYLQDRRPGVYRDLGVDRTE
jgi:hypothetical protein